MRLVQNGRQLTIGLLKLTDAAPVIIAKELGLFAREGLDVALSVEPSWATLADKLAYGILDAGVMLPPLVFATNLGLRGAPRPLVVPMNMSLGGNTVTLSEHWSAPVLANGDGTALSAARAFARLLAERRDGAKPILAIVHAFSSHNLLLRYWLAAGGIDPGRDISFTVIPPARVVDAMRERCIDGFCVGAPWGEVAHRASLGATVATSHGIWMNGPEKVLALSRAWADQEPDRCQGLLRALLRAACYCDAPENIAAIAAILALPAYLDMPADLIRASLPGVEPVTAQSAHSRFFSHAATYPWQSQALWFLAQMVRWGYLTAEVDCAGIATAAYRPDLYAAAAQRLGLPIPVATKKREGGHDGVWRMPATPDPIAMEADLFCDGAVFDPDSARCTQSAQAVPTV